MSGEKKTEKKKKRRVKSFFADFKAFINKGNILELAIAVVIGGAFGKIVSSLVNDIIMPFITLIAGGNSVKDWKWVIKAAEFKDGVEIVAENAVRYGIFLQSILDFLIIALCIFLAVRICMKIKNRMTMVKEQALSKAEEDSVRQAAVDEQSAVQPAAQAPVVLEEASGKQSVEELLSEIRDLLKNK